MVKINDMEKKIKEITIKIRQVEENQICICDDNGKDILYLPYNKHSLAYHYLYAKMINFDIK